MEFGGKRYIVHNSATEDWIKIWNFADIHLLNAGCHVNLLRKHVEEVVNDPYSFWFGGGDYSDYVVPGDKRFDPAVFDGDIKVTDLANFGTYVVDSVYKELSPIKHKCLGLLYGNHEDKYQVGKLQEDLHGNLCNRMGVRNLGYSAFSDVCLYSSKDVEEPFLLPEGVTWDDLKKKYTQGNNRTYRFFLHHGVGHATTRAGKLRKLSEIMRLFEADVYMVGHVHDTIPNRETRIGANSPCSDFVEEIKYGIVTGGYLKTYVKGVTTYGEKRLYTPTYLGAASIFLHNRPRRMKTVY